MKNQLVQIYTIFRALSLCLIMGAIWQFGISGSLPSAFAEDTYTIAAKKRLTWNQQTQFAITQPFKLCIAEIPNSCKDFYGGDTKRWTVDAGIYTVIEQDPGGAWQSSGSGSINATSSLPPNEDNEYKHTITNSYVGGDLSVNTDIDWNDYSGNDNQKFNICIQGPSSSSAKQCREVNPIQTATWRGLAPGQYTVSEDPEVGWATTITPSTVTVQTHQATNASILNRIKSAELELTKSATPAKVSAGQNVTYNFSLKHENSSETHVKNISINDDRCSTVVYGSGDSNNNNLLDLNETWNFSCSATINSDTVDSATASAQHPLGYLVTSNQAEASVDVLPTAKITKSVIPGSLPEPGGTFVYTLQIRNTSQESIEITNLSDNNVLGADCLALTGQTIQPGETVDCSYGVSHTAPGQYINTANVTVKDNEGNQATDSDSATVSVANLPSSILVSKSTSTDIVSELGAVVDFTVVVTNTSITDDVTITALDDSIFGDTTFVGAQISATNCSLGSVLSPNTSYRCSFSGFVVGAVGDIHTNFITARAIDDDGVDLVESDSATIVVVDSNPALSVVNLPEFDSLFEPGAPLRFDVSVSNISVADVITLNALTDSVFGSLTVSSDTSPDSPIVETSCALPVTVGPGNSYECYFVANVQGRSGTFVENTVVAVGQSGDGNSTSAFDVAKVGIVDIPAVVNVTKAASTLSVLESGEPVQFVVSIVNDSTLDTVEINAVDDDLFGNIGSSCTPAIPATLVPNSAVTCTFTETVAGNVGTPHMNIVTVTGFDDDNNPISEQASVQINFEDVPSAIEVIKKANRATASRSGEPVEFEVRVSNLSVTDSITLEKIDDSIYGNVAEANSDTSSSSLLSTDCSVPQELTAGSLYVCTFTALVNGALNEQHRNVVTVTGTDDDQQPVSGSDEAIVLIADPIINAVKSAIIVNRTTDIAQPGDNIRYTILVSNSGNAGAEGIEFIDIPDVNTSVVVGSVQTTGGTVVSGNSTGDTQIRVQLDELPAGETFTLTFDVVVADPLPKSIIKISNQGLITGNNFPALSTQRPGGSGATETFIQSSPIVEATKRAVLALDANNDGNFSPGDHILYEVSIRNSGSAPATDVQMVDVIDANTTLLSGSVNTTLGNVLEGNGEADSAIRIEIPTLDNGETALIRFTVAIKVSIPQSVDQIINQASITTDQSSILTDDPEMDGTQDPTVVALRGVAQVDASKADLLLIDQGEIGASPGDTLIYQVTIRNSGSVPAANVFFEDVLDPNTSLVAGTVQTDQGVAATGNNSGDSSVLVNIGDIPPDGKVKISFQVKINVGTASDLIAINNQGVVRGTGFTETLTDDPDIDGRLDPTITVLQPTAILKLTVADIFLIDADGDGLITIGDTLLYQLTLSNVGRNVARQILIEDLLDANMSLVPNSVNADDGTVEAGNSATDKSVVVSIDLLPEAATTSISFQAIIKSLPASGVLHNQALARFMNGNSNTVGGQQVEVQSDDPATDSTDDPTLTVVGKSTIQATFIPIFQ